MLFLTFVMRSRDEFKIPVEVKWHLNEGYTQVQLLAGSEHVLLDIETTKIPVSLRTIGSRFLLVRRPYEPDRRDSAQDIREALQDSEAVEPLDGYWVALLDQTQN